MVLLEKCQNRIQDVFLQNFEVHLLVKLLEISAIFMWASPLPERAVRTVIECGIIKNAFFLLFSRPPLKRPLNASKNSKRGVQHEKRCRDSSRHKDPQRSCKVKM